LGILRRADFDLEGALALAEEIAKLRENILVGVVIVDGFVRGK
jgi:hypothetical protein